MPAVKHHTDSHPNGQVHYSLYYKPCTNFIMQTTTVPKMITLIHFRAHTGFLFYHLTRHNLHTHYHRIPLCNRTPIPPARTDNPLPKYAMFDMSVYKKQVGEPTVACYRINRSLYQHRQTADRVGGGGERILAPHL